MTSVDQPLFRLHSSFSSYSCSCSCLSSRQRPAETTTSGEAADGSPAARHGAAAVGTSRGSALHRAGPYDILSSGVVPPVTTVSPVLGD